MGRYILPFTVMGLLLAPSAFAQDSGGADNQPAQQGGMMMPGGAMMHHNAMSGGMGMQGMGPMLGQHMMNVTVTGIDAKTGLVDATAGSMALKLHFPPPSLAGVKVGDRISVHLAFHRQ